jgi:hypothetical protein
LPTRPWEKEEASKIAAWTHFFFSCDSTSALLQFDAIAGMANRLFGALDLLAKAFQDKFGSFVRSLSRCVRIENVKQGRNSPPMVSSACVGLVHH